MNLVLMKYMIMIIVRTQILAHLQNGYIGISSGIFPAQKCKAILTAVVIEEP